MIQLNIIIFCGYLIFVFCSDSIAAGTNADAMTKAKKSVLKTLKDPDSAKFGKYTQIKDIYACLTVNARNAFGGYTGDQQASLLNIDHKWVVLGIAQISHGKCLEQLRNIADEYKAESSAKKAVSKYLKKTSVMFGAFSIVSDKYACLEVNDNMTTENNANKKQAILNKVGANWVVLNIDKSKHSTCKESIKYISYKSGAELEAIKTVLNQREWPSEVKFGEFEQVDEHSACLAVNSDSLFDNDKVDHRAVLKKNGQTWDVLSIYAINEQTCREIVVKISAHEVGNKE